MAFDPQTLKLCGFKIFNFVDLDKNEAALPTHTQLIRCKHPRPGRSGGRAAKETKAAGSGEAARA